MKSLIGNGVVVDPARLLEEIDDLTKSARIPISPANLRTSATRRIS